MKNIIGISNIESIIPVSSSIKINSYSYFIRFKQKVEVSYIELEFENINTADTVIVVYLDNDNWHFVDFNLIMINDNVQISFKSYLIANCIRVIVNSSSNSRISGIYGVDSPNNGVKYRSILLSNRTDGLVQRLISMLHTMALADFLDVDFGFTWVNNKEHNKFHDVKSVQDMFSKNYIVKYYFDYSEERLPFNLKMIKDNIETQQFGQYATPNPKAIAQDFHLKKNYLHYYNSIEFSQEIESARKLAIDIAQMYSRTNSVAIHIRGGDIVYDYFKKYLIFIDKVIPIPLILECLTSWEKNATVFLVSQDEVLMDELSRKYNCIKVSSLYPANFTSVQKIFFDIEFMSCCNKVYGGNSAPAILPALLRNNQRIDINMTFNQHQKYEIITKWRDVVLEDSKIPNEWKAYTCVLALAYGYHISDANALIDWCNKGMLYDKNNPLFNLIRVILLYRVDEDFAENESKKIMLTSGTNQFDGFFIIKGNVGLGYLKDLKERVEKSDLPYANLILALCAYKQNKGEALKYYLRYQKNVNETIDSVEDLFKNFNV